MVWRHNLDDHKAAKDGLVWIREDELDLEPSDPSHAGMLDWCKQLLALSDQGDVGMQIEVSRDVVRWWPYLDHTRTLLKCSAPDGIVAESHAFERSTRFEKLPCIAELATSQIDSWATKHSNSNEWLDPSRIFFLTRVQDKRDLHCASSVVRMTTSFQLNETTQSRPYLPTDSYREQYDIDCETTLLVLLYTAGREEYSHPCYQHVKP